MVEHITDLVRVAPMVQNLEAPVPQMVEQLPDILSFFDALMDVPEQVIEVPKILLDDVPMRAAVRDTQLGEQLVEVPTEPVYVAMVLALKVYSRREIRRILSGQGSTTPGSQQIVDNPVPQDRGGVWCTQQPPRSHGCPERCDATRAVSSGPCGVCACRKEGPKQPTWHKTIEGTENAPPDPPVPSSDTAGAV